MRQQLDIAKLRIPKFQKKFVLELRNCFSALAEEADNDVDNADTCVVQTKWEAIKKTYQYTGETVLGYRKRNNKEWITADTWDRVGERKNIRKKLLDAKSPRIQERLQSEYRQRDREVKKSARKDKRSFVDNLAKEAEEAAVRGEISTVYKITKQLCNKNTSKSIPVKSKDGKVLTTEREQAARWVQHFQEILNRPEPDDPANPAPADTFLEIDVSQPTVAEVRIAIKTMKSGRAPGVDAIHAEMLKTDIESSVKVLHDLIGSIWTEEVIPDDWEKGLLTRIC